MSDRSEATQAQYTALSRKHLETAPFGAISLDKLRASDVEGLILALRSKGLSPSTIRSTYTALRAGLDGAVRDGLLAKNPENGVHIKAAADLLGHSSVSITGDVYGHTSDSAARSAVDGWSGVLGL